MNSGCYAAQRSGSNSSICEPSYEKFANARPWFNPVSLGTGQDRVEDSGSRSRVFAAQEQPVLAADRLVVEVLFTLLAECYERGSILLTSNLAFSKWDQIFKDAMTTAAAIDRLMHHSVIIELNVPSYRVETAKKTTPQQPKRTK